MAEAAPRAILLAAGAGRRLGPLGHDVPKSLLRFGGRTLLERHIRSLSALGVRELVLVTGFRSDLIREALQEIDTPLEVRCVENPRFSAGSALSLWHAREALTNGGGSGAVLLMDADVLYSLDVLAPLVEHPESALLMDRSDEPDAEAVKVCLRDGRVADFGKTVRGEVRYEAIGESIGFFRLCEREATWLAGKLCALEASGEHDAPVEDAIRELVQEHPSALSVHDVTGRPWIEIDFPEDVERANKAVLPRIRRREYELDPQRAQARTAAGRLRALLESDRTEFLMEAHSGLSARIVEEAGFEGIWASGLAISALCGVRDHNELSWTQVLEAVSLMVDATDLPILLDGDTGYGDFNNVRRLVRKLERIGGAGVCIEDKLFPKTNSFIRGEAQPLASIDEFCGKIKAAKDSQSDPDFCVVARVEALIAGWGMDEALERATAYHDAGADAILIHSKRPDPSEIIAFSRAWARRSPLVIVPTTYSGTPTEVFKREQISVVVWANALVRASISHMQEIARTIQQAESLTEAEARIVPVREVFRLQRADELLRAEERYAKPQGGPTRALILGATRGADLGELTAERPKLMIPIAGRPLLEHLVLELKRQGVNDIGVVAGYRPDTIDVSGVRVIQNPDHDTTGELHSLVCGLEALGDDAVILYGDLLFRSYILDDLLRADGDAVTIVVDSSRGADSGHDDFAYCSDPDDRGLYQPEVSLEALTSARRPERDPEGRFIGMLRASGDGMRHLRAALDALAAQEDFRTLGIPDLLNRIVADGHPVYVHYVGGHWLDVNVIADVDRAGAFAAGVPSGGATR